jgi:hypothetical protein
MGSVISIATSEGPFSLGRGLDTIQLCFKLGITFFVDFRFLASETTKATRVGRPRVELICA